MQSDRLTMFRAHLILCCAAVAACTVGCGEAPPAPPVVEAPGSAETVVGTERLGWSQPAADAVELAAIGYAIYVDGIRSELIGATCEGGASGGAFPCSARLPALSSGSHVLQLASFVNDGGVLESPRSATLRVTVVAATMTRTTSRTAGAREIEWSASTVTTSDRVKMRVELIATAIDQPTDAAVAPDGRLFIAERPGRIRIVHDRQRALNSTISLWESTEHRELLAVALDPHFNRTGHVFVIYTTPSPSGATMFVLARFRAVSDTLADHAVLLDAIPARPMPRAALRFGPDGKLYAAFDDGAEARNVGDLASLNAKVLRLNADGTTPDDQTGGTPVYSYGAPEPAGIDWDPRSGLMWVAGAGTGASRLSAVVPEPAQGSAKRRGRFGATHALAPPTIPSSAAFYQGRLFPALAGDLLVASDEGRHLLRLHFDAQAPARPMATERLLQDRVGGIRAVTIGAAGEIYFVTANRIGRLVPAND
jgi:glucose/arabinose dehydrogenase